MTVASEITRLQWAKADIKTAIENKWVTVPSSTTLDWYPTLIDSIQTWVPQASYNAMQSLAKIPPYLAWSWWSSSTAASKSLKCWDYYIYIAWNSSSSWSRYIFQRAYFVWHPEYWAVSVWYRPESWSYIDIANLSASLYENWVLSISVIWMTTSVNSSTWLLQWGWTASWSVVATSSEVTQWSWVKWEMVWWWSNSAYYVSMWIYYVW